MMSQDVPGFGALRRLCLLCGLAAGLAIMAGGWPGSRSSRASAQALPPGVSPFATTLDYLVLFYPLWFTYYQSTHAPANRLVGPDRMAPLFHEVVAPNDDTLYVSSFTDLRGQPLILTIPETNVAWSLLTMDYYGRVFDTRIPEGVEGTYALTRPGWTGRLPAGVTRIRVPFTFSVWIIRADKFSQTNQDQTAQAELFRSSLRLATLSEYRRDPTSGRAATFPVALYSTAFKVLADDLIAKDAITFLQQLQTAVHSPQTPPFLPFERQVSNRFDRLFGNGVIPPNSRANIVKRAAFIAGAQAVHALIVDSYLSNTGRTNWVTYTRAAVQPGRLALDLHRRGSPPGRPRGQLAPGSAGTVQRGAALLRPHGKRGGQHVCPPRHPIVSGRPPASQALVHRLQLLRAGPDAVEQDGCGAAIGWHAGASSLPWKPRSARSHLPRLPQRSERTL